MNLTAKEIKSLIEDVEPIIATIGAKEKLFAQEIAHVHPSHTQSARNLVHYMGLRSLDIRRAQKKLSRLGLTSLGRCEGHVLATLTALRKILYKLLGKTPARLRLAPLSYDESKRLLHSATKALLGELPERRNAYIMVTLPSEAAFDYAMVRDMMRSGMNCARINCAHDHAEVWKHMAEHVRMASQELDKPCKIMMDLAGPKMRTSPIAPGPQVMSWKPQRNSIGDVLAPAYLWLVPENAEPPIHLDQQHPLLPMSGEWLSSLSVGDHIEFMDRRRKNRRMEVVQKEGACLLVSAMASAYIEPGVIFTAHSHGRKRSSAVVLQVPAQPQSILLKAGDTLIIDASCKEGHGAIHSPEGLLLQPATIGCEVPELYQSVKVGELVRLDDGKIEGVITQVDAARLEIEITMARETGTKLGAEKGINFPQSTLNIRGLTAKDLQDLKTAVQIADSVALSFVQETEDIEMLQQALEAEGGQHLGIILKIETQRGFRNAPRLLLTAMRHERTGVMIARGDLAVEYGWARMAEVQEELLWMCEAAHVPVIWATQVLEGLAKKGLPSRAEITDAAMGQRADCVMLNKGPHILKAITLLNDILSAMQRHQTRKASIMRALSVSAEFLSPKNR